ncbi:MAG: C25 family cysteine peptidase, partial [Candidatus Zixiibacteriota bacterium]
MKRLVVFCLILGLGFIYSEGLSYELTQTVNFSKSSLVFEKEKDYDLIKLSQSHLMNQIGKPALPVRNIFLALPDNAEVLGVEVISTEKEKLRESFLVFPVQPSIPRSKAPDPNSFVQPLSSVYNSSSPFPEVPIKYIKTGSLGGKRIAVLQVHPLEYIPAQRTLIFYKSIQYKLNYALKDKAPKAPRRSQKAEETYLSMLEKIVENPQDISSSYLRGGTDEGMLEYLVVTNETLKSYFQELVDWKRKKGIPSAIRTREWITSNYAGSDPAEKIRNYLKIAYQDSGCVWVVLGGDTDVIPCRYAHIELQTETENIPADLYYSDLDGTWDYDGDHVYGEPEDSLDLFPDLFVGRAPASTTSEVEVFVDKVLAYEKSVPSDYQLKMLFFAEYGDPRTDDAIAKDMIDDYYVPPRFDP